MAGLITGEGATVDHTRVREAETYLRRPRGTTYAGRRARYDAAADRLYAAGISNTDILADVGAGWTELDVCLRVDWGWRGRYVPVDAWLDGVDLNQWTPPRSFDWFTALEVLEHLEEPERLVRTLQQHATKGVVVTTPNPQVWDVLAMDPTHVCSISAATLQNWGFQTGLLTFYGKHEDGIIGLWTR